MTCEECQAILIDIARQAPVDQVLREEARRHAALCAACGETLQEQVWLTSQLRAFSAADAAREAPARVELAVMAAWRAQQAGGRRRAWRTAWVVPGVALAGLAAAAMALLFLWPAARGTHGRVAPAPVSASASAAVTSAAAPAVTAPTSEGAPETASAEAPDTDPDDTAAVESAKPSRLRRSPAVTQDADMVLASAVTRETEFLPLPYVEPLRSTEARHVIRVSMTSGDEMILGMLPRDRRTGEPFEADVLVGEDGIARAIRIVQ